MASIIDGSSYPKYWKLTPDDSTPNNFYFLPKGKEFFIATDNTHGTITVAGTPSDTAMTFSTGASTIDENGNALATSAAVANYLNQNK